MSAEPVREGTEEGIEGDRGSEEDAPPSPPRPEARGERQPGAGHSVVIDWRDTA